METIAVRSISLPHPRRSSEDPLIFETVFRAAFIVQIMSLIRSHHKSDTPLRSHMVVGVCVAYIFVFILSVSVVVCLDVLCSDTLS